MIAAGSLHNGAELCRRRAALRRHMDELQGERKVLLSARATAAESLERSRHYLQAAPAVQDALDKLSERLFGGVAEVIERHLTTALQEILEQPLALKVRREFKRGYAGMSFHIERAGNEENILRGQGGSVANILSVGLRLLALTTLDKTEHRRFLVLDEPDCWLAPELIPRFAKIVHESGKALGFQVLMISHHSPGLFEPFADRVLRMLPAESGVTVTQRDVYSGTSAADS